MKKYSKNFISLFLAFLFLVCSCVPAGFADGPLDIVIDFSSILLMALKASNVTIESTVAPLQDLLDSIYYGANMPWTPAFTYSGPTWDDDILNRSSIKIHKDIVEIDGVKYTDIFISHDAAQKFRVNAFDLETAWNIVSNSNGNYASGEGYIFGVPMFSLSGHAEGYLTSQTYLVPVNQSGAMGTILLTPSFNTSGSSRSGSLSGYDYASFSGVVMPAGPASAGTPSYAGFKITFKDSLSPGGFYHLVGKFDTASSFAVKRSYDTTYYTSSPFEFDWVSGVVPAEILPDDYGLNIRLPSSYSDPTTGDPIYDMGDIITDYPDQSTGIEINLDPSLNPSAQIDADFLETLFNLITDLIKMGLLADLLHPSYQPEVEPQPTPTPEPTPPPGPEPSTPISDVPADWLDQILRWIQETIKQIKTAIETAVQTLVQTLTEVKTKLQDILDHIKQGHIDLFKTTLDVIKSFFAPIFALLRSALSLWHYVVEWVQATAPVFSTFFGFMSGTNYNMVLPIYAALAGPICIAIYKRFGR